MVLSKLRVYLTLIINEYQIFSPNMVTRCDTLT